MPFFVGYRLNVYVALNDGWLGDVLCHVNAASMELGVMRACGSVIARFVGPSTVCIDRHAESCGAFLFFFFIKDSTTKATLSLIILRLVCLVGTLSCPRARLAYCGLLFIYTFVYRNLLFY